MKENVLFFSIFGLVILVFFLSVIASLLAWFYLLSFATDPHSILAMAYLLSGLVLLAVSVTIFTALASRVGDWGCFVLKLKWLKSYLY